MSVYEGSVVVVFEIQAEEADGSSAEREVAKVQALLESMLADETLDLGVTILGASVSDEEVDFYRYEEGDEVKVNEDGDIYIDNTAGEVTERYNKGAAVEGGIGTMGYVVIALSLVLLATLLGLAYMYIKGKQAASDRKAVD